MTVVNRSDQIPRGYDEQICDRRPRSLFWLSDGAWVVIAPPLPKNQPGARRADDRRVISGIIPMLKCGGCRAECPSEYGPSTTVYNRWNRSSRRGIWTHILAAPTEEGWIAQTGRIDSRYIIGRDVIGLGRRRGKISKDRECLLFVQLDVSVSHNRAHARFVQHRPEHEAARIRGTASRLAGPAQPGGAPSCEREGELDDVCLGVSGAGRPA